MITIQHAYTYIITRGMFILYSQFYERLLFYYGLNLFFFLFLIFIFFSPRSPFVALLPMLQCSRYTQPVSPSTYSVSRLGTTTSTNVVLAYIEYIYIVRDTSI